jgi:hypothetical protein
MGISAYLLLGTLPQRRGEVLQEEVVAALAAIQITQTSALMMVIVLIGIVSIMRHIRVQLFGWNWRENMMCGFKALGTVGVTF